ncbi:hypothetical protein [Micromonospora sp. DT229]|uniref:hypothetical protein n=1 Tax=Micromonospora sp. DT229 TaxID=3393430 RepID=UPI003CF941C8
MQPVTEPVDAVQKVLGDIPVPRYVTAEHVRLAVKAVVVHAPEAWPAGPLCRADRTPHPCRLHRWGRRVLRTRSLTDPAVAELTARGQAARTNPPAARRQAARTNPPAAHGQAARTNARAARVPERRR